MLKKGSLAVVALLAAALLMGLGVSSATAGTASDTMEVTATVVTVCDFSASDISFGQYIGQEVSGTSDWAASCTTSQSQLGFSYTVGLHYANSTMNMQRAGESDLLAYHLTGHSLSFVTDASGQGGGATNWVIPAGQIVPAGDYADTVTVYLSF